jgi:hypothetical protein
MLNEKLPMSKLKRKTKDRGPVIKNYGMDLELFRLES